MPLLHEILDRAPAEGARTVVLALLAGTREQANRLEGASDAEALHDFRVSVRRLRSTLRAWRDGLGESVRDRDLRRLRRVARATSEARNAEVLAAWVGKIAGSLPPAHRPAAGWLTSRLARTVRGSDLGGIVERFRAAADSLSRRLEREGPPPSTGTFAAALAGKVREQAASLEASLSLVVTDDDALLAHRARIEGKRLRYLLEPMGTTAGIGARRAVTRLKRLQDLLGDLNDANLAAAAVKEARREGRPGAGLRPGLLALEGLAEKRAGRLFARLRAEVLESGGAATLAPAIEVASALEARARGSSPSGARQRDTHS
jgi:CHAD domain-containing protein